MKQEIIDWAKYRLAKARNTLSDARRYSDDATLDSTVNRIYYAIDNHLRIHDTTVSNVVSNQAGI